MSMALPRAIIHRDRQVDSACMLRNLIGARVILPVARHLDRVAHQTNKQRRAVQEGFEAYLEAGIIVGRGTPAKRRTMLSLYKLKEQG